MVHPNRESIAEVLFIDAVVVCAGLGARSLGGVEDKDMYPIRGQTVIIRAPWINFGSMQSNINGTWSYIIPRRSGDVSQS
jgi:glycine/D-amino acid oxidase-like deaminating enzyme